MTIQECQKIQEEIKKARHRANMSFLECQDLQMEYWKSVVVKLENTLKGGD